jgi:transposase
MICGVDVSSKSLDARIGRDGASASFTNDPEGISQLAEFCQSHQVDLVAMEATGGYKKSPSRCCGQQQSGSLWLNPRAVRNFAQGMGLFEKTDRIDAGVIAWYAQTKSCVAVSPASAQQQQLKAMVTRLRQLTELRVVEGPAVLSAATHTPGKAQLS